MLFESVAIGDDWEDSDIDFAILATPKADYDSLSEVMEKMEEKCKFGVPLHLSMILDRPRYVIERRGGILLWHK